MDTRNEMHHQDLSRLDMHVADLESLDISIIIFSHRSSTLEFRTIETRLRLSLTLHVESHAYPVPDYVSIFLSHPSCAVKGKIPDGRW